MIHIKIQGNNIYVDWYSGKVPSHYYGPFPKITLGCPWCTFAKTMSADQIREMFPIGRAVEGRCTSCKEFKGTKIYVEEVL
jgi:hypothetical protein